MALLSKEDWMKLIALLVVGLFLFETFAYQGPAAPQQPAGDGTGSQPGALVTGAALVDATVLSYGSELAVANVDAKAQAAIDQLKAQGLVQYSARRPDGVLVLNLERRANITQVAGMFDGSNATLGARARLRMPAVINFTASNGVQVGAVFQDISLEFSPQVPVGQNVTVRINANIRDGTVESYNAFPVAVRVSFDATAKILGYEPGHFALFGVKWEDRAFDDNLLTLAFIERYPQGTITILRNNSVLAGVLGTNFSQAYATAFVDRIEVEKGFVDRQRVQDDLLAAGVQDMPGFPDTQVILEVKGEEANFSFVGEFVKYYVMRDYRRALLELPVEVTANNRTYALKERNVTADISAGPVGSEVSLTFSGSIFAGKIGSVRPEEPE